MEDKKEMLNQVKTFLLEHKDELILGGQIAMVVLICAAGIRNDMEPQCCQCRRCRKKKKKRKK